MGRIFGVLVIVLGIWVGIEVLMNGTDGAFGGRLAAFAGRPGAEGEAPSGSVMERARGSVQGSYERGEDRYRSQLQE